ncbi:hypothetical protein EW146_g5939 [Bondarzewia mesenterica]|uniref:Ras-GEF domain-containing protein n=1 Tax=Bondarzewia mesenterica TaxID=1095465 RepID=A0A4S4LVP2_9AGAM|nr:hypothetical protein EW146_g5939 [Bondarzewia mesenterica]
MSSPHLTSFSVEEEDTSLVSTPVVANLTPTAIHPSPVTIASVASSSGHSATDSSVTLLSPVSQEPNTSHIRLPIPNPSTNRSQSSFAFVDISDDGGGDFDNLPPEVASADISMAPDGSFVETSSGAVARELKKRYDRHLGVGKSMRSPYAITAFVNQHGKQMFRVGNRDLSAPAAAAEEAEQRTTLQLEQHAQERQQLPPQKSPKSSRSGRRSTRRSRMSMHSFLPPSMFPIVNRNGDSTPPMARPFANDGPRSPPTRKLRKTRSNPQLPAPPAVLSSSPTSPQPPLHAGRAHSQSVTGADMPRLPVVMVDVKRPPRGDVFSEVMQWSTALTSPYSSSSASFSALSLHLPKEDNDAPHSPAIIIHPFGSGVSFDSPSRRSESNLGLPHLLREMQSFESGLTARADPVSRAVKPGALSPLSSLSTTQTIDEISAIHDNSASSPSPSPASPVPRLSRPHLPDLTFLPSIETSMHTRYSTEVFDVLQTYRGLPLLEKLSLDSTETTVIKMSANADDTAAPRDDPRFVIWGEVYPEADDGSVSQNSHTNLSFPSERRSTKARDSIAIDNPSVHVSSAEGPHKVMVAATIERWIAQLTSELNYDELLVFFLTYRTYISAVDLCHLLICRFHWALGQPSSDHDEMVRRIVRVRTFVAIRLLLASWLNTLKKDPILQKHSDATSTVRKLVSVVRECQEAHARRGGFGAFNGVAVGPVANLSGETSASGEPPRKSSANDDSDLDLDFFADYPTSSGFPPANNQDMSSNGEGTNALQPHHRAILQHLPSTIATPSLPITPTPATLPVHKSAISRALVRTIGRLGRWRRVLNSRSAVPAPLGVCNDVSAFDLELNATGDLLTVRGGVEQYLKMIEVKPTSPTSSQTPSGLASVPGQIPSPPVEVVTPPPYPPPVPPSIDDGVENLADKTGKVEDDPQPLAKVIEGSDGSSDAAETVEPEPVGRNGEQVVSFQSSTRNRTSSSSSGSSDYGEPLRPGQPEQSSFTQPSVRQGPWEMNVAPDDELDFSNASSEVSSNPAAPPGLLKPSRRLPLRRDFEFVDSNRDSVSSMGLTSNDSIMSGPTSSVASDASTDGGLGMIQQWQVNALVDSLSDEEEVGDVEDALRRLEGQMNPQKQRAKESKVNNWIETIRGRMDVGEHGHEVSPLSLEFSSEAEEDDVFQTDIDTQEGSSPSATDLRSSVLSDLSPVSETKSTLEGNAILSPPKSTSAPHTSSAPCVDAKPAVEDAVPIEILQSRVSTSPSLSPKFSQATAPPMLGQPTSNLAHSQRPRVYRCFVLGHGSGELAQHFTMIDRELFLGVKFEELASDDWIGSVDDANVLDWGQFLKDRARWRAEGRSGYKTSALAAARGRFNLIANFVLSEVVLTHPAERPALVGKFIRIAWKCYSLDNYGTLVAIIAGLRSEWVSKAMRKSWHRLNSFNQRIFNDLTSFCDSADHFGHIRNAVAAMSEAKASAAATEDTASSARSSMTRSKSASEGKPVKPAACVPFLGIYLSQLYRFSQLPDLIDPTAPNEAVGIDPMTGNFNAPAHPEVFDSLAPLPPAMQLEPLINVQKQRLIAGAIKDLVAGQHLASRVQFSIDRKLFQRCLRLRGLSDEMLTKALSMYPV